MYVCLCASGKQFALSYLLDLVSESAVALSI